MIRYDYFEHIAVLVGLEERLFQVSQKIICESSKFFKAATTGPWKESSEKIVRLPEADAHIFGIYIGWLHTAILDLSKTPDDLPLPQYSEDVPDGIVGNIRTIIVDSYILGDMSQDSEFCNDVVDDFIRLTEEMNSLPDVGALAAIWTKLPQQSTMRKLLVDYFSADIKISTFLEDAHMYPTEFILEIAKAGIRDGDVGKDARKPSSRGEGFYHMPKDGSSGTS